MEIIVTSLMAILLIAQILLAVKQIKKGQINLCGRVVAVSGSTGGIGRELCRYLRENDVPSELRRDKEVILAFFPVAADKEGTFDTNI